MTSTDTSSNNAADNSYRIPVEDKETWLAYLRERGYVVVASVLSPDEVKTVKDLLQRDLQGGHGVDDLTTAQDFQWNFVPDHGIYPALAQTAGPWYIRGHKTVQNVFKAIWDVDDVITSMDAVLLWPADREPRTEGLHLDQNPFTKPNLDCIQGMVPLLPVTPKTGGLEVVPYSHTDSAKEQQHLENPHWQHIGHFCTVFDTTPYEETRQLLECQPGDLILWDSRVVHGGVEGTGPYNQSGLARLSVTVAMTPRAWATEEVQEERRLGFANGESFNHCPHQANNSSFRKRKKGYQAIEELTVAQNAVL